MKFKVTNVTTSNFLFKGKVILKKCHSSQDHQGLKTFFQSKMTLQMNVLVAIFKELPKIILNKIMEFLWNQWEDEGMSNLIQVVAIIFLWQILGSPLLMVLSTITAMIMIMIDHLLPEEIDPFIKMVLKAVLISLMWDLFGSLKDLFAFFLVGVLVVKVKNGINAARAYRVYTDDDVQQVLQLHEQGLSQNEISEVLQMPKATVGNMIRRGGCSSTPS